MFNVQAKVLLRIAVLFVSSFAFLSPAGAQTGTPGEAYLSRWDQCAFARETGAHKALATCGSGKEGGRGVVWRPKPGTAPADPVPSPGTKVLPSPMPDSPATKSSSVSTKVEFELGSAELTSHARRIVAGIALVIAAQSGSKWIIVGHTDVRGSDDTNDDLSLRRAKAVIQQLVSAHGIDAARLEARGEGKRKLLFANGYDSRNRRVEFGMETN